MNEQQKQQLAKIREDWKPGARLTTWGPKDAAESINFLLTLLDQAQRDTERVARGLVPIYDQLCALSFTHPHLVKSEWLDLLRETRPVKLGRAMPPPVGGISSLGRADGGSF